MYVYLIEPSIPRVAFKRISSFIAVLEKGKIKFKIPARIHYQSKSGYAAYYSRGKREAGFTNPSSDPLWKNLAVPRDVLDPANLSRVQRRCWALLQTYPPLPKFTRIGVQYIIYLLHFR